MSQFQFDESALAQLMPNFRPSDFWFLRRQFNPAFGLFTNLVAQETPTNPNEPSIGTKPVTIAFLARPNGNVSQLSYISWTSLDPPTTDTHFLGVQVDGAGQLGILAGDIGQNAESVVSFDQFLPVNRLSFVVIGINPGNGKLRVWRNGRRIVTVQAAAGHLLNNRYATTNSPLKTARQDSGTEGQIVGRRAAIFFNQLPRAFN